MGVEIKSTAPLFVAFDRPHYQKFIPNHLRDLAKMPDDVMKFLGSGAFVCSITGKHMRSVALDEAHEMLVTKDLKTTTVRPSKEYLDRMLYYYPVQSVVLNAVKMQLCLILLIQKLARCVYLIHHKHLLSERRISSA